MAPLQNQDFRCKFCEKTFKRKFNLDQHIAKDVCKFGNKCFKCAECSCSYDRKPYLLKHMNKMHGNGPREKTIGCKICTAKFSSSSTYYRHMKKIHPKNQNSPQRLETGGFENCLAPHWRDEHNNTGDVGEHKYVYNVLS